ncbi:agmatine deiminase family protein [Labedella populi]|uniref:Agmatine deiminase family protein n=1 Tax=Labedella populi TaxID=2498850 RepID=A0A444QFK4_9MICO|nr:agmatine deiminase family protein [Labedella populi]RWZ68353.1 agmatine deiminase family protein [Labedella populi]
MSAWRMPHEAGEQVRTWMGWPAPAETFGQGDEEEAAAVAAWSNVANAIVDFQPVTMIVPAESASAARRTLSRSVDVEIAPLDDGWLRDSGPTFVHAEDGSVAAIDWHFNGWGQQPDIRWEEDQHTARRVAALAGVPVVSSPIVNEGGGIHVDGRGTVLATRSVQLDPFRNPGRTAEDIEREFARTLGADRVIWLDRGLYRDAQAYGTRGHVDIVAAFPDERTLLVHDQRSMEHPDAAIMRDVMDVLGDAVDVDGRPYRIVRVPAPVSLHDDEGFVDYSYINHTPVNGGVIACAFGDANDSVAAELLAEVYPGRAVVAVDARPIFARGGGIHCITQNQPVPLG